MSYSRLFFNLSASAELHLVVDTFSWHTFHAEGDFYRDYRILPVREAIPVLRAITRDSTDLYGLVHAFISPSFGGTATDRRYLCELLERELGQDSPFEDEEPPRGARMYILRKEEPDWLWLEPEPEFDFDAIRQAAMAEVRARPKAWVAFEFVTPEGALVPHLACELLLPDGEARSFTSKVDGLVRLDNIPEGECTLILRQLDGSSWRAETGPRPERMASGSLCTHVVQPGECLARIAHDYGIKDWRKIWDHARNEELRKTRKNPNILRPGDHVVIPSREVCAIRRSTGQTHRVIIESDLVEFRVILQDHNGLPFKNQPYEFVAGSVHRTGQTDGDGRVVELISVKESRVQVSLAALDLAWTFALSELRLVLAHESTEEDTELSTDDVMALQARLNGLGFPCGKVDGVLGPRTRASLTLFQEGLLSSDSEDDRLAESSMGMADKATCDELTKRFTV